MTPTAAPSKRRWWPLAVLGVLVITGAIAAVVVVLPGHSESTLEITQAPEPVKPVVPIPTVDRQAPSMTPLQAHLVLARQAAADGKYDEVATELRDLDRLHPDAALAAEAATLKAEVSPKAIAAAVKKVTALRDRHRCEQATANSGSVPPTNFGRLPTA